MSLLNAANHSEIWRIATSMDDRKSEIENWDLGAGIYMSFYLLKSSLQEDADTMVELVCLRFFIVLYLLTKLIVQHIISCTDDTQQDCLKHWNLHSYDHGHKSLFILDV